MRPLAVSYNLFLAFAALWVFASQGVSQAEAQAWRFCLNQAKEQAATQGLAASRAEQIVANISLSMSVRRPISVIRCDELEEGRLAVVPDPSVAGADLIAIDTFALGAMLNDGSEEQANFIIAHEIGHILNSDFSEQRQKLSFKQREIDADLFAVCTVARQRGKWLELERFLKRFRSAQTSTHPYYLESRDAYQREFLKCRAKFIEPVDKEFDFPPYLLDGLANLVRPVEGQSIIIRENASDTVLEGNADLRETLTGIESTASAKLLEAALDSIFVRIDSRASDPAFRIPAPEVNEFSFGAAYSRHSGADPLSPYNYHGNCSWPERDTLFPFMRTWGELQLGYKSVVSWLYGASEPKILSSWWRKFTPNSGFRDIASVRDANRTELMLDGLLKTKVVTKHYPIIHTALSRLDQNWQARIAEAAGILLEYDKLLDRYSEVSKWDGFPARGEPSRADHEGPNPFGCPILGDISGHMTIIIDGRSVSIPLGGSGGYLGLNDGVLSFWVRRRARGSAEEMRAVLELIVQDFSGQYDSLRRLDSLAFSD